jgi:hypothetical protein
LIRIPRGPNSCERAFVRLTSAALATPSSMVSDPLTVQ